MFSDGGGAVASEEGAKLRKVKGNLLGVGERVGGVVAGGRLQTGW